MQLKRTLHVPVIYNYLLSYIRDTRVLLSAAGGGAEDVAVKMEAPEYLDLDEIDFSDDSAVSRQFDCLNIPGILKEFH